MAPGPLQGIRVIDLTIWMSGAIGAMLLGDLGADVIKVEGPTGDPVRRYVPIGATEAASAPGGVNYAYALCNRNKRQVTLDLRDPGDRGRLYALVRDADVFITSMRADTLRSLGIDEDSVKSVNPAIVYARAGGLGPAGPRAADRCQDMLGMAYSGLLFTASPEPDEPFAPPGATNDVLTGTMIAFGVLAALLKRQQSGQGETVHASLLQTALWTQLIQLGTAANAPQVLVPPRSRREPRSPGVNQYRCSDGRWIAVAAVTADAWASFTAALGLDVTDPETGDPLAYPDVLAHPGEVREALDEFFAKQPRSHWLDRLEAAGVWCTPVNTLDEVLVDEQVRANEYLSTLDDGLRTVAMPFTLAGYQAPTRAARHPGEDDGEVLLGLVSRRVRAGCQQAPGKPVPGPAKTYLSRELRNSSNAPVRALRRESIVTGDDIAGNRGGTMNHTMTQGIRGPLARIGRRIATIVAECNYAQTQLTSLRNTPERFRSWGS